MTKILFIAHLADLSGASQVLLEVLECVDRSRFDVEVVSPGEGPFAEAVRARGVPVCSIENPARSVVQTRSPLARLGLLRKRLAYTAALRRRIAAFRPDVAFVVSAVNVYGGIAARWARVPVVYHVHEVFPPTRLNRLRLRAVERCADRIIAVSRAGAEAFSPRARTAKVETIHNGIDVGRFAFDPERRAGTRAAWGLAEQETAVGSIGYVTPRKAVEDFLQAALQTVRTAPQCRFFVIGDAPPSCRDYEAGLREFVRANGLGERVRFLPHTEAIEDCYAALDVLVLSSLSESLPRVVLEAMAASVPVVATDVGGVRECIDDGATGLIVPPRQPERLAEAIAALAADRPMRLRLAEAALESVGQRFSMAAFQSAFRSFFDRVEKEMVKPKVSHVRR